MNTAVATMPERSHSLVEKFSNRFGVDPGKLLTTLKATCFKTREPASNEQMMALLVVADQYRLNPFTKEIFAFEDKHKGIVPVVSVDGWARIINEHPEYDGVEFSYAEKLVTLKDGKPCPEWCEARIYRKDRTRPTVVREYLDEVYQPPRGGYNGPWQSHTKRFLRHKTLIQCSRIAFGFAGIFDEDEAHRIIDGDAVRVVSDRDVKQLETRLIERAAETPADPAPAFTAQGIHDALADCKTLEALDDAASVIDQVPEAERATLTEFWRECRVALTTD